MGATILALATAFHLYDKKLAVTRAIEVTTASLNTEYQTKLDAAEERARQTTKALIISNVEALEKKQDEIKDIERKLTSALGSLQWYKQCASSTINSNNSKNRTACPGRELSREDAEFLVREASDADRVVAERDYYYGRYEDVRLRLEALEGAASR